MPVPAPPRRPLRAAAVLPLLAAVLSAVLAAQAVGRDSRFLPPLLVFASLLFCPPPSGAGGCAAPHFRGRGTRHRDVGGLDPASAVPRDDGARCSRRRRMLLTGGSRPRAARSSEPCAGRRGTRRSSSASSSRRSSTRSRGIAKRRCARPQALEALPMPSAGPFARRRVALLRRGLAALTRAFAHASREGDARHPGPRGASLAARPLGDALRGGDRRGRPRSRQGRAGAALRCPRMAGSKRVSRVSRRAPGAGVGLTARMPAHARLCRVLM